MPNEEIENNPDVLLRRLMDAVEGRNQLKNIIEQLPLAMRSSGLTLTSEDLKKWFEMVEFLFDLHKRQTEDMLAKREEVWRRMQTATASAG